MPVPRCFAPLAVSTSAIPLFGTTLGQDVVTDGSKTQTVTVGNTTNLFNNSDTVNIWSEAGKLSEPAVQIQVVSSVQVSAVFRNKHFAGDFMVLSYPCTNIMVQAVAANPPTASIFLSSTPNVTTSGAGAFHDLYLTDFYQGPSGVMGTDNTANYWIIAASGTQYCLPSCVSGE